MRKIRMTILLTLSFIILVGFTKPVSAGPIDTVKAWSDGIKFISALTDSEGENMGQLVNKFGTGVGDVTLGYLCPECTASYAKIQQADIPGEMKGGLVGSVENQLIAMFEVQPRVDVIAHLSEEWVPGYKESQSVYAAGYQDLQSSGIAGIWSITRNIAYLGFVIIMIVIGFMIMFRNKIGGQLLVTIGNTLPRVVISLVLVTFSFAIIGIILDIAGVFMNVISNTLTSDIQIHNIFKLLGGTLGLSGGGLSIGAIVIGIVSAVSPVGIIAIFLGIIIIGAVLFGAIKLWFALLKSYLSILLNVVIAPIAIMMGALPGNDATITNLFKSVLRNALVFPVAFAIVNLPYFLADQQGVLLSFPDSIVGDSGDFAKIGPLIIAIAKVIAIYVAAQTPTLMKAIIPASASKSGVDVAESMKKGLSGIPLVGGMFK